MLSMAAQNTNPFTDTLTLGNISVLTNQYLDLLWIVRLALSTSSNTPVFGPAMDCKAGPFN